MNKENLQPKPLHIQVFDDLPASQAYFETAWSKAHESDPNLPSEARFINLYYKPYDQALRINCAGGVILNEQVAQNPHILTFVYSIIPFLRTVAFLSLSTVLSLNSARGENSILHILEENPSVQYLKLPLDDKKIHDAFLRSNAFAQYENADKKPTDLWTTVGKVMRFRKTTKNVASHWIDRLEQDYLTQKIIAEARQIFPDIPQEKQSAEAFLRKKQGAVYLKDAMHPQVRGKTVKGLFVDAAGTLFEDAEFTKIRPEIAQKIHTESQKRWVYVWTTSGDYQKLVVALDDYNSCSRELEWVIPLHKEIFNGLTVEETIDDLSKDQLQRDYQIKTLKHQQI